MGAYSGFSIRNDSSFAFHFETGYQVVVSFGSATATENLNGIKYGNRDSRGIRSKDAEVFIFGEYGDECGNDFEFLDPMYFIDKSHYNSNCPLGYQTPKEVADILSIVSQFPKWLSIRDDYHSWHSSMEDMEEQAYENE